MANPEKSAPEALREAVERALEVFGGCGWKQSYVDALAALRAAHERPGAYGDEDDARQAAIARDLLEEHREHGECLTLMVKRLAAEWQRHEAAREALAEAGVECETVAEGIRTLDLQVRTEREVAATKAEAAGGVGLLRRLREVVDANDDETAGKAVQSILGEIDSLIAEAEAQPAEEPTITSFCGFRRGWDVCGNALPCKKHSRPAEEPKREPQEGDDVLREVWAAWLNSMPMESLRDALRESYLGKKVRGALR